MKAVSNSKPQAPSPKPSLTAEEVRHVAKLARLRLSDPHVAEYRSQLSSVLDHIAMLERLDVSDVEPMAHPLDITNRLADDEIEAPLPLEALLRNAPAVEGRLLAVPKVLDTGGGSA